jgi:exodeoxyribonuclease V alpha subunit
VSSTATGGDRHLARAASGLLADFNRAGILAPADVHVARRLSRLGGESRQDVLLAAALAVRALRLGSVFVDLATIAQTATVEEDDDGAAEEGAGETVLARGGLEELPWPQPGEWVARVWASPLTGRAEDVPDEPGRELPAPAVAAPLQLEASRLYLSRLWQDELTVARDLRHRAAAPAPAAVPGTDSGEVALARLFPRPEEDDQRRAAARALTRRLSVIAGGPGTGKTTTVTRLVALLVEQGLARERAPLVALAAPTGKAAARLQEEMERAAGALDLAPEVRQAVGTLRACTLHRLLGHRMDSRTRFRHHRLNRLPHDVVVVDETSMVPLPMMARLLEAVRLDARLVLVGDPDQLASVEAGAVLGDIVAPARELGDAGGRETTPAVAAGISVLGRVHRYGGAIARVAEQIRRGDADGLLQELRAAAGGVSFLEADFAREAAGAELQALRRQVVRAAGELHAAAVAGDEPAALEATRASMLLCAHRRGRYGVTGATARLLEWLRSDLPALESGQASFAGQPLLVTENDHELRLYNGDTGAVIRRPDGRLEAVFARGEDLLRFTPTRLASVQTVYAMTIHKSQGSQFGTVAVILPDPASRILTRELLYTAATRATTRLLLVGTEEMVRAALQRPLARASGMRERLWGPGPGSDRGEVGGDGRQA